MNNVQKKREADNLKAMALKAAENKIYLSSLFFAAQALKLYGEAGNKAGVAELKKLIVGYNKKAEAIMQRLEVSVEIDDETKNGLQDLIISFTKAESLEVKPTGSG